ncbi:hypothetical protein PAHAL_1G438200 [Panicum hallii]|uniref:Uncharacterized protein n=1 Tax=Panicum hallii TaxID=206008 RepID=A0A2T8KYB5_9POAL|nr:hypothetical protein PAHAL_1G438200 [Panicum hallii]
MGTGMGTQHMVCTLGDLTHLCEFLLARSLPRKRSAKGKLASSLLLPGLGCLVHTETQVPLFFLAAG